MIRAVIVDDEAYAREELAALLDELGEVEISGSCANAMEAIKVINQEHPDVVFLDIKMPVLDGFDLLAMIDEEVMPYVVFVTAFDEYALKAFEEKTLDYLLKPVDPARLAKALARIRTAVAESNRPRYDFPALKRIPCVSGQKIRLIDPVLVEYVHSDLSGVRLFVGADGFYTELTLKVLEERAHYLRCHRQYLVNPELVDELIVLDTSHAEIVTRSGHKLPVSRRYLRHVKDVFGI